MAKLTLGSLLGGFASIAALNSKFQQISTAFENTLSRDGTGPNHMTADLDINGNRVINHPDPIDPNDLVTLRFLRGNSPLESYLGNATYAVTATAGQTVVETGYDYSPGSANLMVFVNGIKMRLPTDYAETDENSVTFVNELAEGDTVEFIINQGINEAGPGQANQVGYRASGGVARSVSDKFGEYLSVKDYGAVGDGETDDLEVLEEARDAAVAAGKTLYFPDGVYGISDAFFFADGGHAVFAPGATIKLLGATSVGGAVSVPYSVNQTQPLEIHGLTVDCDNIPGENAVGAPHKVHARFTNLTIKNTLHSSSIFGGKALQFEGAECNSVQVDGLVIENCSIGIDFGAHAGAVTGNIAVNNVLMRNVDVPIYVNDTNNPQAADDFDSLEAVVSNIKLRNCGKLTWSGSSATAGGLIVADRGCKLTVRNLQAINDRGSNGTTAYGQIGALFRGTGYGVIIEDVLVVADAVAIYDFNRAGVQSPGAATVNPYVFAHNVRHYGNLDYIVKSEAGIGIGAAKMEVEVGSTLASLAGLVDANSSAISAAKLKIVDRDNNYLTSGLRSLAQLYTLGNTLGASYGYDGLNQMEGEWTPTDASGAGLTFTGNGYWERTGNKVTLWANITYPATGDGSTAKVGGFPFTIRSNGAFRGGAQVGTTTVSGVQLYPEHGGTSAPVLGPTGSPLTNATMSGAVLAFKIEYLV